MKFKMLLLTCFLVFFGISVNAQQIKWLTDFAEAGRMATESGKPMLLDFTADWCGPCRKMDKEFWPRADVAELSKTFICVKINTDQNSELMKQYGVRGIPNIILTDSTGNKIDSLTGFGRSAADSLIGKMRSISANYEELTKIESASNNLAALAELARNYQEKKSFHKSAKVFEYILKLENVPEQREIILINLGYDYLRANLLDKAIETFQLIENEFPKGAQIELAVYGEFLAFERKSLFREARQVIDRFKTQFPKSRFIRQAGQILPPDKAGK